MGISVAEWVGQVRVRRQVCGWVGNRVTYEPWLSTASDWVGAVVRTAVEQL